jgi:hypothetical protein
VRSEDVVVAIGITVVIMAGAALMIAAMANRRRVREMEHRERLAMIERGLMPAPESDPAGFETAVGFSQPTAEPGERYRTAGVLMIGMGFALMLIIGITASQASVGLGIGGGWAVVGAASLFNYYLISRRAERRARRQTWAAPSRKGPEPPSGVVL